MDGLHTMSAGIRDAISKLSLQKGDILLVSDNWVMQTLTRMKPPEGIDFSVPIVFAPDGSIQKVNREQLEEAIRLLDKNELS